nr:DUF3325 domain-containing protein [Comamonas koreensis]
MNALTSITTAALPLALCLPAMLLLSQAMDRHCKQILRRGEPGRRLRWGLRLGAALLLVLALRCCMHTWGPAVGAVAWLGWLSVAAWLQLLILTYAPRRGTALALSASTMVLSYTAVVAAGLAA